MGVVAFTVLMLAKLGLSALVFGRSEAEFAVSYASLPGAIGLTAQMMFAIVPVMQAWRR